MKHGFNALCLCLGFSKHFHFCAVENQIFCLPRTPPFSSDEDSNEEETDEEEEGEAPPKHQKPKPLQLKLNPPNPAQIINRPSRNTPILARQAVVTQSASASNRQDRATVGGPANMAITNMESEEDDDWSDVSELQEIDPKRFQNNRDQNSNVDKRSFGKGRAHSNVCK